MLAHFSHHIVASLLTPLLPFIRDSFSLSYTRAGILVSAFTISYGVAQLPGGWLSDRLGPHRLIIIGISGVAFCGLLVGLATNYVMLIIFFILMGILGGGYHPSASPLVSSAVEEKARGKALGIHQIGGTGSYFLSPLIAVAISRAIGWRGSFISLSAPTLVYGILFFMLLKRWGYRETHTLDESGKKTDSYRNNEPTASLISIMIVAVCIQIFVFSSLSFIPLYVVDHFNGSEEAAAVLLSVAHSAGIWAGPLAGTISDRIGKIPIILFTSILAGPLIYLLNHVSLGVGITAVLLLLGMTQYMSMPVTEAYFISHSPKRSRSTILGTYYFVSRGGPGLLTPVMGYLIDRYSFSTAYLFTGALMGSIGVVCTILILSKKAEE